MVRRGAFERRALQLGARELDAAADRGAVGKGAGQFEQLVSEFARGAGAVDHGPVDDELLRAEARPLDEADGDALMRAGFDGLHHQRIGDRRRVALPLQQEFRMVDAARHVGGQHQEEVDGFGGTRG